MSSAGLILAAGGSRRLGRPKQLLEVGGRPLLQIVVDAAAGSRLDEVVVVLGGNADAIRDRVDFGRARVMVNPLWEEGMSSSLKLGVEALGPEVARVVVILGDQPAVSGELLDRLLDLQESSGRPAAALSFEGLLHPPVVMERVLWAGLEELTGDVGCRAVIRGRPDQVAALPMPGAGNHPVDVDTEDDYRRLVGAKG